MADGEYHTTSDAVDLTHKTDGTRVRLNMCECHPGTDDSVADRVRRNRSEHRILACPACGRRVATVTPPLSQ